MKIMMRKTMIKISNGYDYLIEHFNKDGPEYHTDSDHLTWIAMTRNKMINCMDCAKNMRVGIDDPETIYQRMEKKNIHLILDHEVEVKKQGSVEIKTIKHDNTEILLRCKDGLPYGQFPAELMIRPNKFTQLNYIQAKDCCNMTPSQLFDHVYLHRR